jgi:hypothetical protein
MAPAHQYQSPSVTAATIKPAASAISVVASPSRHHRGNPELTLRAYLGQAPRDQARHGGVASAAAHVSPPHNRTRVTSCVSVPRAIGQQQLERQFRLDAARRRTWDRPLQRERWATVWATTVASSPTPNSSDDPRVRRKWTPQKYSPGTTVLAPSSVIGKPMASNAGSRTQPA